LKVSHSSGSSTQKKRPHEKRGRGLIQNEADLLDTDLLPIRTAVENPPTVCEAAPMACAIVILLCFMHRFLKSSRVEHQREVSSVSGEVILSAPGDATCICPITGQPSLAPISVTRIATGSILR
jgi:hypothetical protein